MFIPMLVLTGFLVMAGLIVIDSNQRDIEANRANLLQNDLDHLRIRTEQDAKFFEIVRELMVTTNPVQRQELITKLKAFSFDTSIPSSTTTVPKSKASSAPTFRSTPRTSQTTPPTTIPRSRPPPTTTPKKPPSTTTTTQLVCITVPQTKTVICS